MTSDSEMCEKRPSETSFIRMGCGPDARDVRVSVSIGSKGDGRGRRRTIVFSTGPDWRAHSKTSTFLTGPRASIVFCRSARR